MTIMSVNRISSCWLKRIIEYFMKFRKTLLNLSRPNTYKDIFNNVIMIIITIIVEIIMIIMIMIISIVMIIIMIK